MDCEVASAHNKHLEICEEGFFIEGGLLETERVNDIVDLDGAFLKGFISVLGGRVGTWNGLVRMVMDSDWSTTVPISTSAPGFTVIMLQSTS